MTRLKPPLCSELLLRVGGKRLPGSSLRSSRANAMTVKAQIKSYKNPFFTLRVFR
jgi:hypothetical protein